MYKYIGLKFKNTNDEIMEIVNYRSYSDIDIRFQDGTILYNVSLSNVKKGTIKNPNNPIVYGVGYIGIGIHKARGNKYYDIWHSMLRRCYSKEWLEKWPTYIGCSVCSEWLNFQNFANWCLTNYVTNFVLDKDIIIKGNKLYSPTTACFVPEEINLLFGKSNNIRGLFPIGVTFEKQTGKYYSSINRNGKNDNLGRFNNVEDAFKKYKSEKEFYIKEIADRYKSKIDEKIYQAMYNYQVEITD